MTTMSFGGFGGGGFGSQDPNVQDKLAKLKAKKGNDPSSSVKKFLEDDLGVDTRKLPYNLHSANERLREIAQAEGADVAALHGNSMGIVSLTLSTTEYPAIPCPSCGASVNDGYWAHTTGPNNTGSWLCYECDEQTDGVVLPDTTIKIATPNDQQGLDWNDVERVYTAYTKYVHGEGGDANREYWSFKAVTSYTGIDVTPVEPKNVNPDPTTYPTGSVLRLEKHILDENGATTSVREYVRVGGLWDEETITNLETMTPIHDLTGWTTIEEIA